MPPLLSKHAKVMMVTLPMLGTVTATAKKANKNQYKPIETPVASLSRSPPNNQYKKWNEPERETCPRPRVKPPPPKDRRMFWRALGILLITGGLTAYAKGNPEVRDWLSIYAPWFDDFVAVAYQENMDYLEFAMVFLEDIKQRLASLLETSRECTPNKIEINVDTSEGVCEVEDDDESPCAIPIATKDICEIETCLKELAEDAIHNYMTARDSCLYYIGHVQDTMNHFTMSAFKNLRLEMQERRKLVKTSVENAKVYVAQLDEITQYLECSGSIEKEKLTKTMEMLKKYKDEIKKTNIQYQLENELAGTLDSQWKQLEVSLREYMAENKAVYPMLDYDAIEPTITGDADFLIHHARRHINKLQQNLKHSMEMMTNKIDALYGSSRLQEQKGIEMESIAQQLKRMKEIDEKAIKDTLKEQQKKYDEELFIKVKAREEEIVKTFHKIVTDRVNAQRKLFGSQLDNMKEKLDIVEGRQNARLKADREIKRSQDLLLAAASVLQATKKGDPYIPVSDELRTIERACGDGDQLVLAVLNSIPQSVWDKGVVPESVLRENYRSMETMALNVALVEQDGAPLPIYFISWLQAAFLFMKLKTVPQIELDNPPKEPYNFKHLDTFDLLQRARYFMNQGDMATALRYVSALEGASRSAASKWYEAARAHLETRQAAEAVIAHAAAIGLQYI